MSDKHYRVRWEIDVEGEDTPHAAAEKALAAMNRARAGVEDAATVFEVTDVRDGQQYTVDLAEDDRP